MTRKELILEAMAYRRHTGASLEEIRAYAQFRMDETFSPEEDRAILGKLSEQEIVYPVGKKWFLTPAACKVAKGSALRPEWEREDAWILLAILSFPPGSTVELPQVIGVADYINHSIPSAEELHGSLNRLLAGGLIRMNRFGFMATKKGLSLNDRVEAGCSRAALDQWEGLHRMMKCPCCGVRLRAVRWRFRLDEETHKQAYLSYLGLLKRRK